MELVTPTPEVEAPPLPEDATFTVDIDTYPQILELLEPTVEQLGTLRPGDLDWQDAIRVLARIRKVLETIRVVDADLVRHIYLTGEHGDQELEGLGRVRVVRGKERIRWESRSAVFAYLDSMMVEQGGEIPEPAQVAEWVMEVLPANASTSVKVSGLKRVGIDPRSFCEESPGALAVQFLSGL